MKVTGPGFSFDASGTIGGTLTFSKWKGRNYIRTTVTPANPQSDGQVAQRAMMKFLSQNWGALSDGDKSSWYNLAQAGSFSTFNAYVRENLRRWTLAEAPGQQYPVNATLSGSVCATPVVTAGVRALSVAIDLTTDFSNWGIILYRKLNSAPVGVKNEVRAVLFADAVATYTYQDSPLTTGDTWYYAAQPFAIDGTLNALTAAGSGTVG